MCQSALQRVSRQADPLARRAAAGAIESAAGDGGWSGRHGFARVEFLAEHVGYIDLRAFHATPAARASAIAAIRLLERADVLILDLQRHRGGDESMAALLTSLLFDTEPLYAEEWCADPRALPRVACEPRCRRQRIEVLLSRETSPLGRAFARNLTRLSRAAMAEAPG